MVAITAATAITLSLFNTWFTSEYSKLKDYTESIFQYEYVAGDYFTNAYLRIRKIVTTSFFNNPIPENFQKYFHETVRNERRRYLRDNKKFDKQEDIHNEEVLNEAEGFLNSEQHDKEAYHIRNDITVRLLFKYIEVHHPAHEHLWKSYYLQPNSKSYKALVERTGYTFRYIDKIMRALKKDVRKNFPAWANANKDLIKI